MYDQKRSVGSQLELRGDRNKKRHIKTSRKIIVYILATTIVLAMLTWIGVLAWGTNAVMRWLLAHVL